MVLLILLGGMLILTGHFIFGGIALVVAFGVWQMIGGGDFNDRSTYEKRAYDCPDLSVEKLYENLKDVETPFGKCWLAEHDQIKGDCIVFGPGPHKDFVTIGKDGDDFVLKMSTVLSHIKPKDGEASFGNIIKTKGLEVTPTRYAKFAADKVMSVVMMEELVDIIHMMNDGREGCIGKTFKLFNLYHFNTYDGILRDGEDNEYGKCVSKFRPVVDIKLFDNDGAEAASVKDEGTEKNPRYVVRVNGEEYGEIYRTNKSEADTYELESPDGTYEITAFRAISKANLSCNYRISLDGIPKAVIAANGIIEFENIGKVENNIICSYDDDYLVLYALMSDFILTSNRWIR